METTTLNLPILGRDPASEVPQNAVRPMRDAVDRALRGGRGGWVALALHLSRLKPPAPRPHHSRIARAVLNDAAARREGQLFTLPNGDLALLFQAADTGIGLAMTLARLFAADGPDPDALLSRWILPGDADSLRGYLGAVPASGGRSSAEPAADLAAVAAISASLSTRGVRELLERQTAVLLALHGPHRMVPLFREVRFSLPALEARAAASGHVTADPFLFRHLIAHLDPLMLEAVTEDLERTGTSVSWARHGRPMLHLNLTVPAILSAGFETLAASCERSGSRVAIEVALLEACADAEDFQRARERLRAAGFSLVLDEVSHHALLITKPAGFKPDLLKLDWSRQMMDAGAGLNAALEAIGPGRVVLERADTEEAVRWGLARGIRRFQGRHVDAMLAVGRIESCEHAGSCTLRQCMDREGAGTAAARAGCRNPGLLDAAAPRTVVSA